MKKPVQSKYFDIHGPVFYPAAFIVLTTIGASFFFSHTIIAVFSSFQQAASDNAGWFFILATNVFVVAALFFALSKFGKIRLGGNEAKPEFSTFSWFAMLFSAGIGIGLLFYGVAEPIYHFSNPPLPTEHPVERAQQAMLFTFLHWGLSWLGTLCDHRFGPGLFSPLTGSSLLRSVRCFIP